MKKWMTLLLTAGMLSAMLGCAATDGATQDAAVPTALVEQTTAAIPVAGAAEPTHTEALQDAKQPSNEQDAFDQRLVGRWEFVSADERGQLKLNLSALDRIGFLYDGSYYGDAFPLDIDSDGYEPIGKAVCQGDTITFEQVVTGNPGLELTIQYTLSDVQVPSDESPKAPAFYAKYDNDQLTLVVSGSYKAGPTTVQSIDSTLVFEKCYPLYRYVLEPSLLGDWTDNYGNAWNFQYTTDESIFKIHTLVFTLTTPEGTAYPGSYTLVDYQNENPDCVEKMNFGFQDTSVSIFDATILSFDGNVLTLLQTDGNELIMTKVG